MRASWPTTGAASARSRPLPWGRPSTMSTRTTSARPASAMRWAVVAPTFPAPMTVTLLRAMPASFVAGWASARLAGVAVGRDSLRGRRAVRFERPGRIDSRARRPDLVRDAVGVRGEVLGEHHRQRSSLAVVGIRVPPRLAWLKERGRDVRAGGRHLDAEDGVGDRGHSGQATVEGGA